MFGFLAGSAEIRRGSFDGGWHGVRRSSGRDLGRSAARSARRGGCSPLRQRLRGVACLSARPGAVCGELDGLPSVAVCGPFPGVSAGSLRPLDLLRACVRLRSVCGSGAGGLRLRDLLRSGPPPGGAIRDGQRAWPAVVDVSSGDLRAGDPGQAGGLGRRRRRVHPRGIGQRGPGPKDPSPVRKITKSPIILLTCTQTCVIICANKEVSRPCER